MEIASLQDKIGEYKVPLLFGAVSLACIFIAIFILVRSVTDEEPIEIISASKGKAAFDAG